MDAYTFSCVLKWFAATGNIEESERCGGVESACKLFEELDDKDVISWNSMISGYAANGLSDIGVDVFEDMIFQLLILIWLQWLVLWWFVQMSEHFSYVEHFTVIQ
ncbi:Pentatricopeptide repeat [Dillenia turbinata]|uniref:Pentatricopeptide repeat n=1 Tax=Dillenia turbinata TaxID=194707 RepID=A0AAN8VRS3_9MAGN